MSGISPPQDQHSISLEVFDTTFREKTFGVSFATGEKLATISQLDSLGISFIELNSEDKDILGTFKWTKSKPVLFLSGDQEEAGINVENVTVRASCLVLPSKDDEEAMISSEEILTNVKRSVSLQRKKGKNVFFDAQHFFDGFYQNSDYALSLLETAAKAGASRVVLCDSRGASVPDQVKTATKHASKYLSGEKVLIGIHAHNDCGLATSNTLAAINAGARHVQATVNGIGERAGNADLCQLLPLLVLKLGYNALNSSKTRSKQLEGLKALSEKVSRACGFSIPNQPFVSLRAFSHTDSSHLAVVSKNPSLYEPIDPSSVGNYRRLDVRDITTILAEISKLGLYTRNPKAIAKIALERTKELENIGYKFADALASVHLLILESMGSDIVPFEIIGWETSSVRKVGSTSKVRATIRATVGRGANARGLSANSEGVGPIHAIDLAIKKALSNEFPELKNVKLISYSLNIVDSLSGTAASARARTEFIDENPPIGTYSFSSSQVPSTWATVSVSDDVIDASIRALVDGYRYKLIFLNKRERFALPDWRAALS